MTSSPNRRSALLAFVAKLDVISALAGVVFLAGCAGGFPQVKTLDRGTAGAQASSAASSSGPARKEAIVESRNLLEVGQKPDSGAAAVDASGAERPLPPAGKGPGGVLLFVEVKGNVAAVPTGGCRLKLSNVRTQKDTFLNLKANQPVFKELEPGRYYGTRLSCSTTRIWNLDNLFAQGFDVESGRVSYVGKLSFEFEGNSLKTFRQAPRLESQRALIEAQTQVPAWASGQIVSGYTLRPITTPVIESEGPEAIDVFAKGTDQPGRVLDELLTRLKQCAVENTRLDPLMIGHLAYVAVYKSGKFSELRSKSDTHAFSNAFITCIDNSLRTFQPALKNEIEVRVAF